MRPDENCTEYVLDWHCESDELVNNCTWTGEKCVDKVEKDDKEENDEESKDSEDLSLELIIVIVVVSSLALAVAVYFYCRGKKNKGTKENKMQSSISKLVF